MKKLNLLKPNKKTVYLNYGKGQEVNYLEIDEYLKRESLEEDVKNGATQFKECLELAKKKPSQFVIIECDNEEEGLKAVHYLAAAYNEAEGEVCCEDLDSAPANCCEEKTLLDLSDFERDFEIDEDGDFAPCEEDEYLGWEESAYRIPIIPFGELTRYENDHFSRIPFSMNDTFSAGIAHNPQKEPYWLSLRREPVCIVANNYYFNSPFGFGGSGEEGCLCKELRRFEKNRHVYVVIIRNMNNCYEDDFDDCFGDDEWEEQDATKQNICETILEYTASLITVKEEEKAKEKYYCELFDSWAEHFKVVFSKGFPKREVALQIARMNNPNKAALFEKVYRYVLNQENVGEVLKKEDFAILQKFKSLGLSAEKKPENVNLKKMEDTLVGLEEVKQQVYGIVDVMKYNKKRSQFGLGNGGYHNVHLMLGAPGTAKTTVAQYMGNIMMEQKLLPGNRFISINGAELKGMYVGHSAPKTKAYFDNYDIILIDEAYSITSDKEMDSFSNEAIAQLIIELEKHGMDKLVIFAGYGGMDVKQKENKMLEFLNANPGIRSRINSTICFKSYTPEEMVKIVHCHAKLGKYQLPKEADALIYSLFQKRCVLSDFGNGREARSLLENITMEAAKRVMRMDADKLNKRLLQQIKYEDVEKAVEKFEKAYKNQKGCSVSSRLGFRMEVENEAV